MRSSRFDRFQEISRNFNQPTDELRYVTVKVAKCEVVVEGTSESYSHYSLAIPVIRGRSEPQNSFPEFHE